MHAKLFHSIKISQRNKNLEVLSGMRNALRRSDTETSLPEVY